MPKIRPIFLDLETKPIDTRPDYPPVPVGLASFIPGREAEYLAWGHPSENNSTWEKGRKKLKQLYAEYDVVFHNAKFDLDVARHHFNLWPKHQYFCTQVFAAYYDPYASSIALKDIAYRWLGISPDERDELREWIMANCEEAKGQRKTWKNWGKLICQAPGNLVGKYAKGDVIRTQAIFDYLYPVIMLQEEMSKAVEREMKLIPRLIVTEERGLSINVKKLDREVKAAHRNIKNIEKQVKKILKAPSDLNFDQKDDLADVLDAAGKVDGFIYTKPTKAHPGGKRSVSKDNLAKVINDPMLLHMLMARNKLSKYLSTFMQPWLAQAQKNDGLIYTSWNSTKATSDSGKGKGTRTTRLSSIPNFQNQPKIVEIPEELTNFVLPCNKASKLLAQNVKIKSEHLAGAMYSILPNIRDYIVPAEGNMMIARDYCQQELRILGFFENGILAEEYRNNRKADMHVTAEHLMSQAMGRLVKRKQVKTISFGILYGMGLALLAEKLKVNYNEAKELRKAYYNIFPGIAEVNNVLKSRAKAGLPFRTIGGRSVYCEPPGPDKFGRIRSKEYKMLNYLIQGSAADITKEAFIRGYDRGLDMRLLMHDELIGEAPLKTWEEEMNELTECLSSIEIDLPMLSDGKYGTTGWSSMKSYDKFGGWDYYWENVEPNL